MAQKTQEAKRSHVPSGGLHSWYWREFSTSTNRQKRCTRQLANTTDSTSAELENQSGDIKLHDPLCFREIPTKIPYRICPLFREMAKHLGGHGV